MIKEVELLTSAGRLIIEGESLDMNKLNLEESIISVEGTVNSINYVKEKNLKKNFGRRYLNNNEIFYRGYKYILLNSLWWNIQ